jgi:HAD superfamily hydrolase (TIGR01484 family)
MNSYNRLKSVYSEIDNSWLESEHDRISLLDAADLPASELQTSYSSEIFLDAIAEIVQDDTQDYTDFLKFATLEQVERAYKLRNYYRKSVDTFVLDIDETLRTATQNGNRISPRTCYLIREFHSEGGSIIICTGKSIGYVRGCLTQAFGQEILTSKRFSIVYEAGAGVYTPSAGSATKQRLHDRIDNSTQSVFKQIRTHYFNLITDDLRDHYYFEQKEFNITIIPTAEVKSDAAIDTIERVSYYLIIAATDIIAAKTPHSPQEVAQFLTATDPELASAFKRQETALDISEEDRLVINTEGGTFSDKTVPDPLLQSVDIGYYHGDAVELTSGALGKANGVRVAIDTLPLDDPFILAMGDSQTDLSVMKTLTEQNKGICAAPDHASAAVLDHCQDSNGLIFEQGAVADALQIAFAYNLLGEMSTA